VKIIPASVRNNRASKLIRQQLPPNLCFMARVGLEEKGGFCAYYEMENSGRERLAQQQRSEEEYE